MIRSILFDTQAGTVNTGGLEQLETWRNNPQLILWLDLDGEKAEQERQILESFEFHPLAVEDALRVRHPAKIEQFDGYLLILLRGLDAKTEGIDFNLIQLALVIGPNYLITRHTKPSLSANWLYQTVQKEAVPEDMSPDKLALRISSRLVRRYVEILLDLEPRLDDIEEEMFEKPDDRQLSELTGYKSRLRHLARVAKYHTRVFIFLRHVGSPQIGKDLHHEVIDCEEHVDRTLNLAEMYYETAKDLTDGYLAMSSHRLNNVMQILTVFTVIFVPLTFLAGIYGMNFQNMPELNTSFGYFVVLGVMGVAAMVQFSYFKRRGWI